jgi:UDP-N-acetylmuramoyl-tripeptide--D-alanyl-D-alanine ligase
VSDLIVDDDGHPHFVLHSGADVADVHVPLVGAHQAHNAAAAATVALEMGIPFDDVVGTLRGLTMRSPWRMQVSSVPGGVTLINDAYNANPDSMRAALETLAELGRRRGGRSVAVLGEMRELGESGESAHEEVGRLVAALGVSQLVVVGDEARAIHLAARPEGSSTASVHLPDAESAIGHLRGALQPGDVVLVKASRAAGLERVAEALTGGRGSRPDRDSETGPTEADA